MNNYNEREYDIIVYGASGFTGQQVCLELCNESNLKWAIAGRNENKLNLLIHQLETNNSNENNKNMPLDIIICDNNNQKSLVNCFNQCRLVMNCTGPYRFLGENVIIACIKSNCDYIDLCGEPEFMDKMFYKYHDEAKEKGIYIIHACAFDSIPADFGSYFTSRQYDNDSLVSSIESFLTIKTGKSGAKAHLTTYEAAVHGFGAKNELKPLRKKINEKYNLPSRLSYIGKKLKRFTKPNFNQKIKQWIFPFLGSDASVVRKSQLLRKINENEDMNSPKYQYAAYFTVSSTLWMIITLLCGGLFGFLANYKWGRNLLLKYPKIFTLGVFSKEGPNQKQLDETSFKMKFIAKGYTNEFNNNNDLKNIEPNKIVITEVSGPEPGYIATRQMFVTVGECLLEERNNLPMNGGVYTPGGILYNSTLIDRLNNKSIQFNVLDEIVNPVKIDSKNNEKSKKKK